MQRIETLTMAEASHAQPGETPAQELARLRAEIAAAGVELAEARRQLRCVEEVLELRERTLEERVRQRHIDEKMRDERRALEEIERDMADAAKHEAQSATALVTARAQLAGLDPTSEQYERLDRLANRLEMELKEARDRKGKGTARAGAPQSGYVYILSNRASFGDNVFMIGMTRRLDPNRCIEELDGPAVPFPFDVHAIVFSEDAAGLQARLHEALARRRLKGPNARREYFRATVEEIQGELHKLHGPVPFALARH